MSTYFTYVRLTPRGTAFSDLRAVEHAWHPMQTVWSMTFAHFRGAESVTESSLARHRDVEPRGCKYADGNEEHQNRELCDHERRLRLLRRQRSQRRHFLERLHHADKDIQIERCRRRHHVHPAPRSAEMKCVASNDRDRQND